MWARGATATILCSVAVVAAGLSGCGETEEEREAREEAAADVERLGDEIEEKREELELGEDCARQLKGLVRSLNDLDGLLDVGLNHDEYSDRVGEIAIAYNRIDFKELEDDCVLSVGLPAEAAFNKYVKAGSTWNDCITDFGCELDSIDSQLQLRWASAGERLSEADAALSEMTTELEQELEHLETELEEAEAELAELESG